MIIFETILLVILLLIFIIDIVPIFITWSNRIHIGRWTSSDLWNENITKIGIKWLNSTPKMKVTDNTRLIVIDILKKNYTKSEIQSWQEASLLMGLSEVEGNNKDKIKKEIEVYLKKNFDENGMWINKPKEVDSAIIAYAMMNLEFLDIKKYKESFDYMYNLIISNIGEDGTVKYRNFMSKYRYVDTIGFICPFLISYGYKYKKRECIDLAIRQITLYNEYGFDEKIFLPYHAYNINDKSHLGLNGWGRGLGWYALGLIDSYNLLTDEDEYKGLLRKNILKLTEIIVKYQCNNGSWNWTIVREEVKEDSSTTAILCWFLLNASSIDCISEKCMMSYNKGIEYLMKVTRRNGIVDFSQGDTKDIGVYSQLFDKMPFTQGLAIRSINKYKNMK